MASPGGRYTVSGRFGLPGMLLRAFPAPLVVRAVRDHIFPARAGCDESDVTLMATTNDLKNGLVLNIDGDLWSVVEFQHVKPGKGGAFVRTTLKNVLSGKVVDRTFNAGTKVETATVDKRAMTYLYKEGTDFVFMDGETYDQVHVPSETVGDGANYLLDNAEVAIAVHDGAPLYIELPTSVELVISH